MSVTYKIVLNRHSEHNRYNLYRKGIDNYYFSNSTDDFNRVSLGFINFENAEKETIRQQEALKELDKVVLKNNTCEIDADKNDCFFEVIKIRMT